jgi:hypothetical protein
MNGGFWTAILLPDKLSFIVIFCFDYSYGFNEELQIPPQNPQGDTKNKYISWLTFGTIVGLPLIENAYGP